MYGLSKIEISKRILRHLTSSNVVIQSATFSGSRNGLPWKIIVEFPNCTLRRYEIYMWTVGHGGKTRSVDEYRIQTKLKDGVRNLDFGFGTTLLIGYYDERTDRAGRSVGNLPVKGMEVIVGWNPIQHLRVGSSSSCHVPFHLLEEAYRKGASVRARSLSQSESEQVIAMRSEYFASYLAEAAGGHQFINLERIMSRQTVGWN